MSIADKITSIEEHLTDDYEGLENLGADLTNVNKNIQNIRTCLDNIYTNLPKTTGEGSNLSLTTLKGRINVDDILGDTSQDTTTGKNKLPNQLVSGSANGITYTRNEDGSIKLTGTATARTEPRLTTSPFTISAGTYKNTTSVTIYWYDTGYKAVASGSNVTFSSDTTIQYTYIRIENGATINETIYPQFILSSESDTSYEPYTNGASPNPSYPQDINVVTGTQEVVVQSANYFKPQLKVNGTDVTQVRCAVTLQDDEFTFVASGNDMYLGNVGASGTSYGNNRGTLIKLPTNASKVYVTTTNTDFNANYICWYDENKTTLGFILSNSAGNSIPSGAKYINVRIGKADSVSGTTYKTKVMVRIDDNTTTYVAHQEQTKTLHLGDIELAKIGTYQDRIYKNNDKWYIEKNIGKYTINGESGTFSKPSTNRFNIDGALTDYLKAVNVVACMSDKYVCYAQKGSNSDFNTLVANENFGLDLSSSTSGNTIRIKDTNYDDINQYKTWLASNNVELLYVLATPTYTEITNTTLLTELNELEKMMSYNGTTNINISGNLPMILDITALKGE